MDVKLRADRVITYIDSDCESKTIEIKAGSTVPTSIVTGRLAREYEIFKNFIGEFYIDLDCLNLGEGCYPECIEDLILYIDDFYDADIKGSIKKLCELS